MDAVKTKFHFPKDPRKSIFFVTLGFDFLFFKNNPFVNFTLPLKQESINIIFCLAGIFSISSTNLVTEMQEFLISFTFQSLGTKKASRVSSFSFSSLAQCHEK